MNINFKNFNCNNLISKNAKDKFKRLLKLEVKDEKDEKDIINKLNSNSPEYIKKFFKEDNGKELSLKFFLELDNLYISLEKKEKQISQKEINKQKLRDKLNECKSKRYQLRERKQYMKQEKHKKSNLQSNMAVDSRINQKMIDCYKNAKNKFGDMLPNPQQILDNKQEHIQKFIQYVSMMIQKSNNEEEMYKMLDNEYSEYIGTVTGFDFRKLIDTFRNNMDKMKEQKKEEPLYEKLDESDGSSDESSEEDKNTINSDDA